MVITFQQHIVQEQANLSGLPELQWLLSGIVLATKLIQAQVRRAGLIDILGSHGETNVQGEVQQKLDVYANETLINCLKIRESIGIIASEENEHPIVVHQDSPNAQYAVVFADDPMQWILQPGRKQIAAGYVIYGSSTVLVYSLGNGVHAFTLDPSIGSYILTHSNIKMPQQGNYYSMNEAYCNEFAAPYCDYLDRLKNGGLNRFYSSRFVGSLVADFHRTLLRGGVFVYPENKSYPNGRLRLLYEANPIAFIAEQAGGRASNGKQPILDVEPRDLHERTALIVGGAVEMTEFERCLSGAKTDGATG